MNRPVIQKQKFSAQFIGKCLILFFFLFQVHFPFFPGWLGSEQISFILIFILYLISNRKIKLIPSKTINSMSFITLLFLFLFIYCSLALYVTNSKGISGNAYLYKYCLFCIVIIVIGSMGFASLFISLDEFMYALLICEMVQALFIIYFILFPNIQSIFNAIFDAKGSYDKYFRNTGYHTGIGASEAKGALKMVPGLGACIYFTLNKSGKVKYIVSYMFITVAATLLARTGFFFSILAGFSLLLFSGKYIKKSLKIVGSVTILTCFAALFIYLFGYGDNISVHFHRLSGLFTEYKSGGIRGISFFQKYFGIGSENIIPRLSIETLFGTGVISGTSGEGIKIISDGGYFKLYFAVGMPLAIISYLLMYKFLKMPIVHIDDTALKIVMHFLLMYIFIGEFKEIHIFFGYPLCLFYTLNLLYEKEKRFKENTLKIM